jgi:serine/threonine protein kinase
VPLAPLVGKTLGDYRLVEQIGAGGMGAVYKAYQPSMDRFVAVKVLPHHLSQSEPFRQRFRREARAIAKLEHPHILPAHDYGEQDGVFYIVMRYAESGTLKDRLAHSRLPPDEIVRVLRQAAGALDHAHRRGVIHRDIKPGNFLMDRQGDVYLGDFGLARLIETSGGVSTSGAAGTPAYMAPEQGQGLPVDHRADLYALGVVVYEMLTGRVPYEADTPLGVILKHIHDPLPRPRALAPDLPEAAERVLLRALAKDPDARFASAGEMVNALAAAFGMSAEPAPALPPGADDAAQPAPASPLLAHTPSDELPPFIAGPPIVHPGRFFGRERELKRVFNLLKRPPLQNAAIVGPRRSGKTSLLHYLRTVPTAAPEVLRPGQRAAWLPEAERYRWVFVDFQNPQFGSREGLLRHLLTALNLTTPYPCDMDHFLEAMNRSLRAPAVILFDEIGAALERYPELDDAFWEGLRSLATNLPGGNLAFVLASHQPPDQLARASRLGSPFFNIFGYTAELGPLTEPEARDLISSSPIPFPVSDVDWILAQSGRWPILLQILCRERLVALEDGEAGEAWRQDGLRQIEPFQYLMSP